jgi:sulfite exporter TauE/SafE
MELLIAFLTGLTTGGLSCLAVQGGLLASSVAHEVELSVGQQLSRGKKSARRPAPTRASRPILLFLVAKLAAYTLLGFLLGGLGSVLQLSPLVRAVLQFAIGVFMIGTALRMLKVHPIFRYFVIEPPSFITRYIRRTAKAGENNVTPLFLGALTVLIPCGVTQAMMAVAIGSGAPFMGAALMFAFILGTSPVFFTVAYLATRLGARLEANFMRFVAVVVLVLGVVAVDTGLNLMGSPYSFSRLARTFIEPAKDRAPLASAAPAAGVATTAPLPTSPLSVISAPARLGVATYTPAPPEAAANTLTLNVTNTGYTPNVLEAPANKRLKLALVTKNTYSCSRAFVIPDLNFQKLLPATGTEIIDLLPQPAGAVLYYTCSMGMYTGQIEFK